MLFLSLSRITIDMYSLFQQEFLSFTNNLMALQWEDQDLQSQQKFICRLISMLQYLWYYTLLTFRNDLLITLYSILKCKDLEKVFHHINNLHQNVALATEEKINRKLGFLDNLLKQNNRNISVLTNIYTAACIIKQVARKVLFPSCLIEHIPLSQIKETSPKETLE